MTRASMHMGSNISLLMNLIMGLNTGLLNKNFLFQFFIFLHEKEKVNTSATCFCRHGRQHTIMPTNVNYRANLWALKARGCTHVLVSTACGSLREEIHPGDFVILDQFIDRWGRNIHQMQE